MTVGWVKRVLDSGFPVVGGSRCVVALRELVIDRGTPVMDGAVVRRRFETAGACATEFGDGRDCEDDS
jgi:hypothetical protein